MIQQTKARLQFAFAAVCAITLAASPHAARAQDPSQCASWSADWARIEASATQDQIVELLPRVPRECEALRDRISERLSGFSQAPSRSVTQSGRPRTVPSSRADVAAPPPPAASTLPSLAATQEQPAQVQARAPASLDIQDQLLAGEATFNKPSEVALGEDAVVEVQINLVHQDAPTELGTSGETVTREVSITREVEARLSSPDFDIEPLTETGVLAITDQSVGRWSWRVTPRRSGERLRLVLQIYGRVELPGESSSFALIKQYEEFIDVKVTPRHVVDQTLEWARVNWAVISGIAGALFAGLMFLFGRRRPT